MEIDLRDLKDLKDYIKKAVQLSSLSPTLAISSQKSDKVKGYISITNCSISKGELTVKSSRGNPIKLSCSSITLGQLKMTRNCIDKISHLINHNGSKLNTVDRILHLTQQAIKSLSHFDSKRIFPIAQHFPDIHDCSVDFTLQDNNLVTTITWLNDIDQNPLEQAFSQLKHIPIVKFKGRNVQVVDSLAVETAVPGLLELRECLEEVAKACNAHQRLVLELGPT